MATGDIIQTEIGDIEISVAAPADLEHFLQILEEAEQWFAQNGIVQWPVGCNRRYASFFAKEIERGVVYFARKDAEIIAALIFTPPTWLDKKLWEDLSEDARYIHRLTVRRQFSGKRIGIAILRWAEMKTAAAGRSHLRIDCAAENPALLEYFENQGFAFQGKVDGQGWKLALFEKKV